MLCQLVNFSQLKIVIDSAFSLSFCWTLFYTRAENNNFVLFTSQRVVKLLLISSLIYILTLSFRTTTTAALLLITVFLDVKFHNGSAIRVVGLQWIFHYLRICIIILIGWDLRYVLFFHFPIIPLTFVWRRNRIILINSVWVWRPNLVSCVHSFTVASVKTTN